MRSDFRSDFNGNGKADIFYTDGAKWWVSDDGTSAWHQINTSDTTPDTLFIG